MSAYVPWVMQGCELVTCNCDFGCPCQFNSLPTKGNCQAFAFYQIDKGHFGKTPLDGLRWGAFFSWPGAIHFGQGRCQVVIDERADAAQRAAIEAVAQGRETEPGTLITQVFSATIAELLPTLYKPIELVVDLSARTGRAKIPGLLEANAESIRNPVTGAPHPVRIDLPMGIEYSESEVLSGSAKAMGAIKLDLESAHAHIARIHWSTKGVVR